jgi:ABC-type branched-subunit amino acid transport system substrate-binding protein
VSIRTSRAVGVAVVVAIAGLTPSLAQAATPKAGGSCTAKQVGSSATSGSTNLECKKSGKAGRWVRVTATTAAPTVPATTAAPAPASTAAPAPAASGENGRGVTDTTIKIGFIDAAFKTAAGFLPSSTGNTTAQVNAVVDAINAAGGIGGRKVVPVIRQLDLAGSNRDQTEAICAAFADDDKVFAVSSQSVIVATASKECFAKKKTVYIEGAGSFPFDLDTLKRMAPYGYVSNLPAIDRVVPAYAKTLVDEKWFGADPKSAKVGIVSMDDPAYKSAVTKLNAELEKLGVKPLDTAFFDTTSQATVSRDSTAASTRFAAKGITHVISLASAGNTMQFMWTGEDNSYYPRMAFTSFDALRIVADGPSFRLRKVAKRSLEGSIAIGVNTVVDTDDTQNVFPSAGPEQKCIDIYTKSKLITGFESRYLSRYAQSYCDNLFFMKTVGDQITGPLNADSFAAQVAKLGSKGFDAGVGWLTTFGAGRFDGGDGYRVLKFDSTCSKPTDGCFVYASGVQKLG